MKHIRSARNVALVAALKRGRKISKQFQWQLAKRVHRTQSWLANIEIMQRRCDVLEFVDLGDAMYEDRLTLIKDLLAQSPRRFFPPKGEKRSVKPQKAGTPTRKKTVRKGRRTRAR